MIAACGWNSKRGSASREAERQTAYYTDGTGAAGSEATEPALEASQIGGHRPILLVAILGRFPIPRLRR